MIYISVHGIHIGIECSNESLISSIKDYYQLFLVESGDMHPDILVELDMYGYFERATKKIFPSPGSIRVGDTVWLDRKKKEYTFFDREISAQITWNQEGCMQVKAVLKPLTIRHWVNIALQGTKRISKYYNRFFIKTAIHDPLFLLLEKRFGIILLHATAVTDGEKALIFTGLGGSGKSTLASAFRTKKHFTILSDNYCLVHEDHMYPFPELPRITKETAGLLNIEEGKKADGIKSYLENTLQGVKDSYPISSVFFCSYSEGDFQMNPIENTDDIYEYISAINHYTKEFPEYLNLALLSFLSEYNTTKIRHENLSVFAKKNHFYFLENSKEIEKNLDRILNV